PIRRLSTRSRPSTHRSATGASPSTTPTSASPGPFLAATSCCLTRIGATRACATCRPHSPTPAAEARLRYSHQKGLSIKPAWAVAALAFALAPAITRSSDDASFGSAPHGQVPEALRSRRGGGSRRRYGCIRGLHASHPLCRRSRDHPPAPQGPDAG